MAEDRIKRMITLLDGTSESLNQNSLTKFSTREQNLPQVKRQKDAQKLYQSLRNDYKDPDKQYPQPFDPIPQSQRMELEDLNSNDREIDRDLEQLGGGVVNLKALARKQNEEVHFHNSVLDTVAVDTNRAQDRVTHVHQQLKSGMKTSRWSVDKICIDIFCLLITLGLLLILYGITSSRH